MKREKSRIFLAAGILALTLCLLGFCRAFSLTVTRYTIRSAAFTQPLTIVQLSDLHCAVYGQDNAQLLAEVAAAQPDLIVMTGDIINQDADAGQVEAMVQLTAELSALAPACFSLGNHEVAYCEAHGDDLCDAIAAAGATVLEQDYVEQTIGGQRLRIGGIYGYVLSENLRSGAEQDFVRAFTDTALPTVLLCHIPEGLLSYGSIDSWAVDLVFSGHAHGGQIRLPGIGGLYDPETGWFPEYTRGVFQRSGSAVVLSAGLGTSIRIPRFNNPPELVVVSIEPA